MVGSIGVGTRGAWQQCKGGGRRRAAEGGGGEKGKVRLPAKGTRGALTPSRYAEHVKIISVTAIAQRKEIKDQKLRDPMNMPFPDAGRLPPLWPPKHWSGKSMTR
jgi:hypothetical protein